MWILMKAKFLKYYDKKDIVLIMTQMHHFYKKIEYCFIIVKYEKLHYIS